MWGRGEKGWNVEERIGMKQLERLHSLERTLIDYLSYWDEADQLPRDVRREIKVLLELIRGHMDEMAKG